MNGLSNEFLYGYYNEFIQSVYTTDTIIQNITFEEIRNKLILDLNKLIRTLEYYLIEYVGKIEIEFLSSDIKGINPDKVLNYNYTDTYQKLYGKDKQIDYDFIHGKADQHHSA